MRIEHVLKFKDRDYTYYLGALMPQEIQMLTFVPCSQSVPELENVLVLRTGGGYQREGDVKRMQKIRDHYRDTTRRSVIPPILLSTRGQWEFTPVKAGSPFGSIEASDLVAIIDGQHRSGGLSLLAADTSLTEADKSRSIPFMAVELSSVAEEQTQFEVINDEAKGIPKSFLKFINAHKKFAGKIALALRDYEDSVFFGRIAPEKRKDWDLITFGSAEDIVLSMFNGYLVNNTFRPEESSENMAKAMVIALTYWRKVSECFPELWSDINLMPAPNASKSKQAPGRSKFQYRLLEETGLKAFAKIAPKILYSAWMGAQQEIAWSDITASLEKMSNDVKLNLVMKKLNKASNKEEILAINPKLQFSGASGIDPLYEVLEAAFERARLRG